MQNEFPPIKETQAVSTNSKPPGSKERQFVRTVDGLSLSSFFLKEEAPTETQSSLSNENEEEQQSKALSEPRYSNLVLDRKSKSKKSISENSNVTVPPRKKASKKFSREVSTKLLVNVKPFKEYLPHRPPSTRSKNRRSSEASSQETKTKFGFSKHERSITSTSSNKTTSEIEELEVQEQTSDYYFLSNFDPISLHCDCGGGQSFRESLTSEPRADSSISEGSTDKQLKDDYSSTVTKESLQLEKTESSLQPKKRSSEKNELTVGMLLETRFSNPVLKAKVFENRVPTVELQKVSTVRTAGCRIEESLLQTLLTSRTLNEDHKTLTKGKKKGLETVAQFLDLKDVSDGSGRSIELTTKFEEVGFLKNLFSQKPSGFIKCHPMLQDRIVKAFKRKAKSYENVVRSESSKQKKGSASFAVVEDEVCRSLDEKRPKSKDPLDKAADKAPKLVSDHSLRDNLKRSLNFLKKVHKSDFDVTKDSSTDTRRLRKAKSTASQNRGSSQNGDISASSSQNRKDNPEEKVLTLKRTKTLKRDSEPLPLEGNLRRNLEKVKERRKVFLVKENGLHLRKEVVAAFDSIRNASPSRKTEKASLVIVVSKK